MYDSYSNHPEISIDNFEVLPHAPVDDALILPYFKNLGDYEKEIRELVADHTPFLEGERFDGKKFSIFLNQASDPLSAPAKALDASVREEDKNWRDSRSKTVESLASIQENSFYFTYIDTTDPESPQVKGTLMVSDLTNGGSSETVTYFKQTNPGESLPDDFVKDAGENLWDIVSVMTSLDSRDGITSAYLYHALYKRACDVAQLNVVTGLPRDKMTWISCLSENEHKNLNRFLGIPFKPINGTATVHDPIPGTDKTTPYSFCSLKLEDIYASTGLNIVEREKTAKPTQLFIAKLARIALLGTDKPDVADVNPAIASHTKVA